MITNWLITGDTHSSLERFYPSKFEPRNPETTGIIILGDAGFNYYLNYRDDILKHKADRMAMTFYCVRGNHEARPQDIDNMTLVYDENVQGNVYMEPAYPGIRYFLDGGFYTIANKKTLVIGGAYSIDKQYRLARGWSWFENEQLDADERAHITDCVKDYLMDISPIDLVLTHTAPIGFEPTEMFLDFIDQTEVDKTMEYWLQEIYNMLPSSCFWLFGHYHGNMIMGDNIAMISDKIIALDTIDTFDHQHVEFPEDFRLSTKYQYLREVRNNLPII